MDQESVDAGPPCRSKCIPQDLMGGFEIDIAHHVETPVQITVADRGDDDISDLAMIDAGNLLCGLRDHVGRPFDGVGKVQLDQVSTALRKLSMRSKMRSGVCTVI